MASALPATFSRAPSSTTPRAIPGAARPTSRRRANGPPQRSFRAAPYSSRAATTPPTPFLPARSFYTVGAMHSYAGLWWNAPAGSESGWGINFAHQADVIFATWFTYDATGKALWLTMTANSTAENTYAGTLFQTRGPAFSAVPFSPAAVSATAVGSATLTFSDANNASFAYVVNGISQTKAITRQVFAAPPTCTFGALPVLTFATNFQDLWWAAPAGAESGWGVNFTHQGDIIFATWFTYDVDGTPLWLSAAAAKTGPGVYTGTLYRTTGPAFSAVPFLPGDVVRTPVGALTLTFADGSNATFAYTVDAVAQTQADNTAGVPHPRNGVSVGAVQPSILAPILPCRMSCPRPW